MTALVDVSSSLVKTDTEKILGQFIDKPAPADDHSAYAFRLGGWVVGRHAPVDHVELLYEGMVTQSAPLTGHRPGAAANYPEVAWAGTSGWKLVVDTRRFEPTFACRLQAVFEDGTSVPLAVIQGERQRLSGADPQKLQPLLISAYGRSGTTWLMRLLGEHPEVITYGHYPYEMRPAHYWAHMFQVLSAPADWSRPISSPSGFAADLYAVGANPFQGSHLIEYPGWQQWTDVTYREQLAQFCLDSIEGWYRGLAGRQEKPHAKCFAEKGSAAIMSEMYPEIREIFLLRDFRDIACSALAFNAKRGNTAFGRERVDSDEAFLYELRGQGELLLKLWRQREKWAHLVRYEELVAQPHQTLTGLLTYAGLDASATTVEAVLKRAGQTSLELEDHRTSASPQESIGRWRRDLDPSLQKQATELFSDLLASFGYNETMWTRRSGSD